MSTVYVLVKAPSTSDLMQMTDRFHLVRNVKVKHKSIWAWLWKHSEAGLITITCLYTAGSSMRAAPESDCQHRPTQMHLPAHTCLNTYLKGLTESADGRYVSYVWTWSGLEIIGPPCTAEPAPGNDFLIRCLWRFFIRLSQSGSAASKSGSYS